MVSFCRFLFPFSSKFPDQNFASYVLYIFPCGTRSEPGLPVMGLATIDPHSLKKRAEIHKNPKCGVNTPNGKQDTEMH